MNVHYSSKSDEWATPQELFDRLAAMFGPFTLDPCATLANTKCERYYTIEDDGLTQSWVHPSEWVRELLPLKSLQLAHVLVELLTNSKYLIGNGIPSIGTSPIGDLELYGELSFLVLDPKIWQERLQDANGFSGIDVPTPRNTFVVLARLIGGDSPNTKRIREEVYRRLMYHLDLEMQGISRRAFLSAGSFDGALFDMYTALSVNDAGAISQDFSRYVFHSLIIPPIGGFVKDALDQCPATVFCNPPYGRKIGKWVEKAYHESLNGATVVCLIPARTDTAYWHDYVMRADEIILLRGRIRFVGGKSCAPFPSAIVVFKPCNKSPRLSTLDAKAPHAAGEGREAFQKEIAWQ